MSNKLKRKTNVKDKPKTASIHSAKRMNGTPVKSKILEKKPNSLVQKNPKLTVLVLIATYFLLDYLMMSSAENLHIALIVIFTLLAPSTLYSYYVFDYQRDLFPAGGTDIPKFVKNKKKYATIGWLIILIWGIVFLVAEPVIIPRFFPVLNNTYYSSQIILMLFVAPVMEEIIFRYLLYDRWLRRKWGWFWGFMAASLIFVICHPVTNMHSLIIYWAPTLLFFLIYHEFGLYGAIVMHMIYNMMAI